MLPTAEGDGYECSCKAWNIAAAKLVQCSRLALCIGERGGAFRKLRTGDRAALTWRDAFQKKRIDRAPGIRRCMVRHHYTTRPNRGYETKQARLQGVTPSNTYSDFFALITQPLFGVRARIASAFANASADERARPAGQALQTSGLSLRCAGEACWTSPDGKLGRSIP